MKKILSVLLALVLMLAVSAALADDDTVTDTVTVKVELSYQYSMARDMITAINNFRTGADGKDVWYWNSDNKTTFNSIGWEDEVVRIVLAKDVDVETEWNNFIEANKGLWQPLLEEMNASLK